MLQLKFYSSFYSTSAGPTACLKNVQKGVTIYTCIYTVVTLE